MYRAHVVLWIGGGLTRESAAEEGTEEGGVEL